MNMASPNKFRQLMDLGYDHLLCVIPPDAPGIREAGKRPGLKGSNGWYGKGVREFDSPTLEQADLWNSWGGGAGIRCNGKFIAIDIDSLSPEWAGKIQKAALKVLGPAPVRIGRAPKSLLVYRAADNIAYRNVRFDDGADPDKPGLVECLSGADGTKWFVAIGVHPATGKPYTWPDGIPHASELTTVSEQQISAFFERLRNDLPKVKGASSTTSIDREQVDQEALKATDPDEVAFALDSIVNTPDNLDYNDWVRLAAATRAAFAEDPDRGMDLFCDLSERAGIEHPKEDPKRVYKSVDAPFGVGGDFILDLARRIGTEEFKQVQAKKEADLWFNDETEDPFGLKTELNALKTQQTKFQFLDLTDAAVSALNEPAKPLVKGLIDQGTMSVVYGDSNVGKTFVAMDLAYHIGAGKPYAGLKTTPGLVVYVAAEGGNGAKRRVAAIREKYGKEEADRARFKLLASSVDLRRPDADLNPFIEALRAIGEPISMVVVDTLSRALAGGDENSPVDMGAIVKHFDAVRSATSAHMMVIHHTGKNKASGARGHSLLRAATDTEIEVEEGVIRVTKQRDLDKSWSSGFTLDVVTLGVDADLDPITSCTVKLMPITEAQAVVKKRKEATPLTSMEETILDALAGILEGSEAAAKGITLEQFILGSRKTLPDIDADKARFHLRSIEQKGHVVRPKRGFWALKGLPPKNSVSETCHTNDYETEENGGEGEIGIFD